jgi:uncharacterized protein YlxW (UPF0749 family)
MKVQKQTEQSAALRDAERRLADEQDARQKSEQQAWQSHQQDIRQLQQKCDDLQREKSTMQSFGVSCSLITQINADILAGKRRYY